MKTEREKSIKLALFDLLERFPKRRCVLCGRKDRAPIYVNSLAKLCPDCLDEMIDSMRGFDVTRTGKKSRQKPPVGRGT